MDPNLLFTVNVPALSKVAGALPSEVIDVARLFDGQRVVASVLEASHLTPRMTVAVVGRLLRMGILNPLEDPLSEVPELRWVAAPIAPPPTRDDDPLDRALALAETLELPVTVVPATEVPAATVVVLAPADPPVAAPTVGKSPPGFEDADEQFFGSYQPESPPDDFVDLEDRPYSRRLAARRREPGGWVRSFLGRLNALLP